MWSIIVLNSISKDLWEFLFYDTFYEFSKTFLSDPQSYRLQLKLLAFIAHFITTWGSFLYQNVNWYSELYLRFKSIIVLL
jgi:hypothetical protein